MKKLIAFSVLSIFLSCSSLKKTTEVIQEKGITSVDTLSTQKILLDQPSASRKIDILHTKLKLSFDWEKQYLYGKASITLKPYFYSINEIVLDAKFDVKSVFLLSKTLSPLPFFCNKKQITITLDKEYTRFDTLKIVLEYVAKPSERAEKTGLTFESDKGLYFINPQGRDKNKPTQLWTQGEPESNSSWFPTVDKMNERMTQELYITVDSSHKHFVTLSNGLLISSLNNPDGTRTDYWKQSLPSPPYLTMMAIGDFEIIKDKWKNLEVNYYVEPAFKKYARSNFGNTPEMIEFFSDKLGVTYPWEKFSQIVVQDFVTGAMENTSAVVHGPELNQTNREIIDRGYENNIAHELFHQWFGDYVTCEQWSNLTLNEGLATYGEFLWQEYKYGRDAADFHAYRSIQEYLGSSQVTEKLIRYQYNEPNDVFDCVSYNKGGAVIHMLRTYVGDEAFFGALKTYLDRNKFSSVEADNLRLIFEEVCGEDLNWFFNQWFHNAGHPQIAIRHHYNDSLKQYSVNIQQKQDMTKFPCFKFPLDIDVYLDGKKERQRVWVNDVEENFIFSAPHKPDLVNVDAEKYLVCVKEENKSIEECAFQYKNCPLFLDRLGALTGCSMNVNNPNAAVIVSDALNDKSPYIRESAIQIVNKLPDDYKSGVKEKLVDLAKRDNNSGVRSFAIYQLATIYPNDNFLPVYLQTVNDSSYWVIATSLLEIAKKDESEALRIAKQFESEEGEDFLLFGVANLYSLYGSDKNQSFFVSLSDKINGRRMRRFVDMYIDFLKRCKENTIAEGIIILEKIARNDDNPRIRLYGRKGIKDLANMYTDKKKKITEQITKLKEKGNTSAEFRTLEQQFSQIKIREQKLNDLYESLKALN